MYKFNDKGEITTVDLWRDEEDVLRVTADEFFAKYEFENPADSTGNTMSDMRNVSYIKEHSNPEHHGDEIDLFIAELAYMRSWQTLKFSNKASTKTFDMSGDALNKEINNKSNVVILVPDELARLINELDAMSESNNVDVNVLSYYLTNVADGFHLYKNNMSRWTVIKSYLLNVLNNRDKWKIISLF